MDMQFVTTKKNQSRCYQKCFCARGSTLDPARELTAIPQTPCYISELYGRLEEREERKEEGRGEKGRKV